MSFSEAVFVRDFSFSFFVQTYNCTCRMRTRLNFLPDVSHHRGFSAFFRRMHFQSEVWIRDYAITITVLPVSLATVALLLRTLGCPASRLKSSCRLHMLVMQSCAKDKRSGAPPPPLPPKPLPTINNQWFILVVTPYLITPFKVWEDIEQPSFLLFYVPSFSTFIL